MRPNIFRKHFLILGGVTILFTFIGLSMNQLMRRLGEESHQQPKPPVFFARIIDQIAETSSSKDRVAALIKLEELKQDEMPFRFSIVDQSGQITYPKGQGQPIDWTKVHRPENPYQFFELHSGPGSDQNHLPMPPPDGLIRFKGLPEQYLMVQMKDFVGPPPFKFFVLSIALLILSVWVGVGVTLALIYKSVTDS